MSKDTNAWAQGSESNPSRLNLKRPSTRHNMVKLQLAKDKTKPKNQPKRNIILSMFKKYDLNDTDFSSGSVM